jgi:hypothetical protein
MGVNFAVTHFENNVTKEAGLTLLSKRCDHCKARVFCIAFSKGRLPGGMHFKYEAIPGRSETQPKNTDKSPTNTVNDSSKLC